ncbi:DUF2157 domain-containing protein [Janthinobacterium sp. EB271-G4-7A]|uniref:DUF2157 domain-containing protein n=1 Tax=Janthinobacterium sp. EB271-G4-7A TaxID=2775056 RepID=UPI0022A84D90|nr:DUF2157 domain-containing protein [Janthinobacterium sp. EB271-G4-7A]
MNLRCAVSRFSSHPSVEKGQRASPPGPNGLAGEPPHVAHWLLRITALLAAAMLGLSLILWVAANWDLFGRASHFLLLQTLFAGSGLIGFRSTTARTPMLLTAMLFMGALFGYFSQTYQTSSDPWQLFAAWAIAAMPLCLATRSDVLWIPWILVSFSASTLWLSDMATYRWDIDAMYMGHYAASLLISVTLCGAMTPFMARWTGAGAWPLRMAIALTTLMAGTIALGLLLDSKPTYGLPLLLVLTAILVLLLPRFHDVICHSIIALGANTILTTWLAVLLSDGDLPAVLIFVGLTAAGMLATTGYWLLWRHQLHHTEVSA